MTNQMITLTFVSAFDLTFMNRSSPQFKLADTMGAVCCERGTRCLHCAHRFSDILTPHGLYILGENSAIGICQGCLSSYGEAQHLAALRRIFRCAVTVTTEMPLAASQMPQDSRKGITR